MFSIPGSVVKGCGLWVVGCGLWVVSDSSSRSFADSLIRPFADSCSLHPASCVLHLPNFCGYTNDATSARYATGLRSRATASQPRRRASSGIEPPPAKGSSTRGARPPWAWRIRSRARSSSAGASGHSSLLKSTSRRSRALRVASSVGASTKAASVIAREAVNGRRAKYGCIAFSDPIPPPFWATWFRSVRGRTSSMRRLGIRGLHRLL